MSASDYEAWWAIIVPEYASDKVANGTWSAGEALEKSRDSITSLLTQGLTTPGHHLITLMSGDTRVGYLWLADKAGSGYVYDVYVYPSFRRQGFGRAAMLAMEAMARGLGMTSVSLHVFGFNHAAAALYRSIGYEVTDLNLRKRLPAGV
jgi:ribosomal protein S18 acetylase RimI-like enzyme